MAGLCSLDNYSHIQNLYSVNIRLQILYFVYFNFSGRKLLVFDEYCRISSPYNYTDLRSAFSGVNTRRRANVSYTASYGLTEHIVKDAQF